MFYLEAQISMLGTNNTGNERSRICPAVTNGDNPNKGTEVLACDNSKDPGM